MIRNNNRKKKKERKKNLLKLNAREDQNYKNILRERKRKKGKKYLNPAKMIVHIVA